jgi:hypothetical protein
MQRIFATVGIAIAATAALTAWLLVGGHSEPSASEHWAMVDQYCVDCHNDVDFTADFSFESLTPDSIGQEPELFEEVVRKLRGRMMPPPDGPRPPLTQIDAFVAWTESRLDARGHRPESGQRGIAPAEPHRICQCDSRPAASRDRCKRAAAEGR